MKSSIVAALLGCIASVVVGAPVVGERDMLVTNDVSHREDMIERAVRLFSDLGESIAEGSDSNLQYIAAEVSADKISSHDDSVAEEPADTRESEAGSDLSRRAEAAKEPERGYPAKGLFPVKGNSGIVGY